MNQKIIEQITSLEEVIVKTHQIQATLKPVEKTIIFLTPHIPSHMRLSQEKLQRAKKEDFNQAMKVYCQALAYRPGDKSYQNFKINNSMIQECRIKKFVIGIHYDKQKDTRVVCIPIHSLNLTQTTIQQTYETLFIECQFMAGIIRKTKKLKILQFMTLKEQQQIKIKICDDAMKRLKEQILFPQQMDIHMGFVVKFNPEEQQFITLNGKQKQQFQKLDIYFIRPNCKSLYIVNQKTQKQELCSFIQMKNMELGIIHKGFNTIINKLPADNSSQQNKKISESIKAKSVEIKSAFQKTLNSPVLNFFSMFAQLLKEAQCICQKDSEQIANSSLLKTGLGDKQNNAFKKVPQKQISVVGQIDKNILSYAQIRKKHQKIVQISERTNIKQDQFPYKRLTVAKLCQNLQIQNYLSKDVKLPERIKGLFVLNQIKSISNFMKDITTKFKSDTVFKNNQLQFPLIKLIIKNLFGFMYNLKDLFNCLDQKQIDYLQLINLLEFYLKVQEIHIRSTNVKSSLLDTILTFLSNKPNIDETNIIHYLKRIPSEQNQSLMYYDIFQNILKSNQNPGNANDSYMISKKISVKFNKAKLLFDNHLDSKNYKVQALKLFYLDLYMQVFHEKAPFFEKRAYYANQKFTTLSLLIYCSKLLSCLGRPDLVIIIQQKLQRYSQVYRFYKQRLLKLSKRQAVQQQKNAMKYFQSIMEYQKATQFCDDIISQCTNQKDLETYQNERINLMKNRSKTQRIKKMKAVPIDPFLRDQIDKMTYQ